MHKAEAMKSHLTRLTLVIIVATGLLLSRAGKIAAVDPSPESLMQLGLQSYQRGAFDQALAAWKVAAQLYQQSGKPMEQSRALVQAAQASESMGQVTQAQQQLELALALAEQGQDKAWTATVLSNLGHASLAAGQPDAAMEHLTRALEIAPDNATPVVATIQNNLGLAMVAQKKLPEALTAFTAAAKNATGADDRPLAVRA